MKIGITILLTLSMMMFQLCHAQMNSFEPKKSGFYLWGALSGASAKDEDDQEHTQTLGPGVNIRTENDVFQDDRSALSLGGRVGVGWKWNSVLKTDLSYTYMRFHFDTSVLQIVNNTGAVNHAQNYTDGRSHVFLLNMTIDMAAAAGKNQLFLHPFFGAGLGASWNKTFDSTTSGLGTDRQVIFPVDANRTDFAWQTFVGLDYFLTQFLSLTFQYSFLYAGKYQQGNQFDFLTNPLGLTGLISKASRFSIKASLFTVGTSWVF